MLKKRLIPVLYIMNGLIVRSETFSQHKIIGNVVNEVQRYNQWNIDELVYIDISRTKSYDSRRDDHRVQRIRSIDDILKLVSQECFMPLTFGGGIRDYETIAHYLNSGADKVVLNTLFHTDPKVVRQAIQNFGAQAIVAALDFRVEEGEITFYHSYGKERIEKSYTEMADYVQKLGCGEVLLTSIDQDGTGEGYDMESIKKMLPLFDVPVVACGGAMDTFDFVELSQLEEISGIAAGNMFHFTENSYPRSKKQLVAKGLNFRQ
ncbi:MAG: HisA/HisF-related TIM barrel protein [Bacteroidota bacterium]